MLVRFNQELIPKVLDIEATSERVVSSSKAYHELVIVNMAKFYSNLINILLLLLLCVSCRF